MHWQFRHAGVEVIGRDLPSGGSWSRLRRLGMGVLLAFTLKGLTTTGLIVFAALVGLGIF